MKNQKPPVIDQAAIDRELRSNWIRTFIGIALMGALSGAWPGLASTSLSLPASCSSSPC